MKAPERRDALLLVDDTRDDVFFFRRAWKAAGAGDVLQVVEDGPAVLDYLEGSGDYRDRSRFPFPALVVLDLKIPKMPGLDVLAWIRKQATFSRLPVVVLTSSRESSDMARARELGVLKYHVKPVDVRELHDIVKSIAEAWAANSGGSRL